MNKMTFHMTRTLAAIGLAVAASSSHALILVPGLPEAPLGASGESPPRTLLDQLCKRSQLRALGRASDEDVEMVRHEAVRNIFNLLFGRREADLIHDQVDHGWIFEDDTSKIRADC